MSAPTSIGELSVGVTLDTSEMEAGLKGMDRKLKGQLKQLDKEYEKLAESSMGFGGGYGTGYGRSGKAREAFYRSLAGGGGGAGEKLARTFGGQALGRVLGGGGEAVMGLGPAAGIAAGVAIMVKLQLAVANFAKESGKLDGSTRAVIRYGETLNSIGATAKRAAGEMAVGFLGALNRVGEIVGSGFNFRDVADAEDSDRAAAQAVARLAKFREVNDPAKLAAVRSSISQFARDQAFSKESPKGQQSILREEIAALKAKEETARAAGKILEAEEVRLARLQKVAQLEKSIADFRDAARARGEALDMARLARLDAADAQKRETAKAADRVETENKLDSIRDRIGGARNPFEARSTGDFGSASAATANFAAEGNRLLSEMVRILRAVESNTEDALARN